MKTCKNCAWFKRAHWWPDGTDQLGGSCEMLARILRITNSDLRLLESLHVQESFSCVAHCENKVSE